MDNKIFPKTEYQKKFSNVDYWTKVDLKKKVAEIKAKYAHILKPTDHAK